MRLAFALLMSLVFGCGVKPNESQVLSDSLRIDSNVVRINEPISPPQSLTVTIDTSLADSLRIYPLAIYHGEYMLTSSSPAEQARLHLEFTGRNSFSFSLVYEVADFCNARQEGVFTVDASNTGTYEIAAPSYSENRPLTFMLSNGGVELSDPKGQLGVGQCQLSGNFRRCDGPCEEISWEGFGEDSDPGVELDPADSAQQHQN